MADSALLVRIKALTAFRAVFVTLLLGSSYLFGIEYLYASPKAISYFIIFLYSLTIVYSLLILKARNLFLFMYVQLIVDVFSEISLIYITGGVESWFSFTLLLTVLSSSILLNKRAGYVTASLSAILYGLLLDFQFFGLLHIPHEMVTEERQFLYKIFIHVLALFSTAYLSGYLSHRLEKTVETLEEKDSHLKDLEHFNTRVIESLPSGLFTTDVEGRVLVFNRAAARITESEESKVIGGKIESALPFLGHPFREGRYEEVLNLQNGRQKIIGITVSVLRDLSGNDTGYIGVFQDLTKMKTLEDEVKRKEKWAAIGELSANIAHEIRNPLASLKGSVEMLREDKLPQKHREKLMDIAIKEMERLDNTVTDFLTYSSPKPLELQRFDLHQMLDETISLLANREKDAANVSIRKNFSGPNEIEADPQKIRQVFWNLGLNAIEAMPEGGTLTIGTKIQGQKVIVSFADTGTGISKKEMEKIFFPFFTTKEKGTGLGLSIAYRIIEEHGGRLVVRSEPGIMTVFEIILDSNHG